MKPKLTIASLRKEAAKFAKMDSVHTAKALYGVTDGKAVGTFFEHAFRDHLKAEFTFSEGSSAKGIDFPSLLVDMKVTSVKQPQSSCPFKSARQKIFGLGYSLLVFVYEKRDDKRRRAGVLRILHTVFVEQHRTADYQTTSGLLKIIENDGNVDDLVAFMAERHLPVDDIAARKLADEILASPPDLGFLTISNALQWRLQYSRIIERAGSIAGILRLE